MRIVSLLPSATEIVYALGLGDELAGVTAECDHPPEARTKPIVSRTAIPEAAELGAAEIDALVRERVDAGTPLYRVDEDAIRRIQPDLILAQDLCRVCAVPSGQVADALATLGCRADVLSLDPGTLDEVIGAIEAVGRATGRADRAAVLAAGLRGRVAEVRRRVAGRARRRVLALEWRDPPFAGGHWVPDMVEAAGGLAVLAAVGEPSRRVGWDDVGAAAPDVVVFMPCGYGLARALEEGADLARAPGLAGSPAAERGEMWAVDASSYFSRPGPRLVDGLEILAWAVHPGAVPEPPPGTVARLG